VGIVAFSLVLSAAFVHATWNLLAKRAPGGPAFVWLFSALAVVCYFPLAAIVLVVKRPHFGGAELLFIFGSGMLHLGYFLLLQQGYRFGDLSLIYPLARGTGPTLSTIGAILFFDERPTPLAIGGAIMVVGSVFLLTGGPKALAAIGSRWGIGFGLMTGFVIAIYTLWDKHAVSVLLISPIIYDWTVGLIRTTALTPYVLRNRDALRNCWRLYRREALGVAILSPLAYLLVLTAMISSPVSYVAPAREISILIGAIYGARLLREGDVQRRLMAASGMVAGIIALAIG
jgi:drug/metabolite transporter (DMT)-like permease